MSRRVAAVVAASIVCVGLAGGVRATASTGALTRAPYLTDTTAVSTRLSWATLAGGSANVVAWGAAGGSCADWTAAASGSSFSVDTTSETMWTARLGGLMPATAYCYQILAGGVPVLSAPITFTTPPAPGATSSFSFDVLGDTGYDGNGGVNPDQDNLYAEMAGSGASLRFIAGDIAYPSGSQTNYGDLVHTGSNISAMFGPSGWGVPGGLAGTFPALGNHGRTATFLKIWPVSDVVTGSSGVNAMVTYPGQLGASTATYPTVYYAFTVDQVRFYLLDASWSNSNVGSSTLYGQDYVNHWSPGDAEYQWLAADLAAHPGALKFAVFHFPLHSDNSTETTDTYLDGTTSLEGLLAAAGVDIVFNGHAHIYQRNGAALGGMVSYVTGGGGAVLEPTGGHGCSSIDLYSIGWSPSSGTGSRCGAATRPTSASQVYHFLHVTVTGSSVTVAPRNALNQTFDVVTYQF